MPTGTMSADPGWVKTMNARTMVTAWVWFSLATLSWFAIAEEPCWDATLSDSEPRVENGSVGGFLPVPVWKFLKGNNTPGSGAFVLMNSDTKGMKEKVNRLTMKP